MLTRFKAFQLISYVAKREEGEIQTDVLVEES
jgi:hypothetical protein